MARGVGTSIPWTFTDKFHRAQAVSPRGHGRHPISKSLARGSITDYVDDAAEVADGLPAPPVVIGHSTRGLVVQPFLDARHAPAGVLIASIAARGIGGPTLAITAAARLR